MAVRAGVRVVEVVKAVKAAGGLVEAARVETAAEAMVLALVYTVVETVRVGTVKGVEEN